MLTFLSPPSPRSYPFTSKYVPIRCLPLPPSFHGRQRIRYRFGLLCVSTTTRMDHKEEASNRELYPVEAARGLPKRVSGTQPRAKSSKQINQADLPPHAIPVIPPSELPKRLDLLLSSNVGASLRATVCHIADSLIGTYLDPLQLKASVDPKVQLSGTTAPVPECPPVKCLQVEGSLPPDLNGVYIRNGPNAARINANEGHHIFDGDGMLHAVRIKDRAATYCCRYVRTSKFLQEEEAGRPLFPRFFGGFQGAAGTARCAVILLRAALGLLDLRHGCGLANESVLYFNGKVLAMSEDDMPYVVNVKEDGDIETVGKLCLSGPGWKFNMCAHPKLDPITGEMFAFSYSLQGVPRLTYFRVSADGVRSPDVRIPVMDLPFIHDFAVTKKFVIFADNQFVIQPLKVLKGNPIVLDKSKTPRFGIIPLSATPDQRQAQWFEVPGCNSYHYLNAWDEGDEIVMITPVLSTPEFFLEPWACIFNLTEVRLNTRTGASQQKKISSRNLELGTFNHGYTGRKNRYAYFSSGPYLKMDGVVKVDFTETEERSVVARREHGESWYGSEPFFVPRSSEKDAAEDDGYLVAFVHNEETGASEFRVMDAKSPSLEMVASVKLPSRVPHGFHGYFVTEEQLANARCD